MPRARLRTRFVGRRWAVVFAAGLLTRTVGAQPGPRTPPASEPEAVDHDAVFARGLERYEASDFVGAIAIWEQLLELLGERRGFKILYNLGLAHQAVGDATRAIERFEAFQARVGVGSDVSPALAERREDAAARVRALKAAHGAVHVRAPASGGVVLVAIGSAAPRPAGFTVYLAPGEHVIELDSGTARAHREPITVVAGQEIEISPEPAASSTPSPTSSPQAPRAATPRASRARRTQPREDPGSSFPAVWVALGSGAALVSLALPIALRARATSKRDDAAALGAGHTAYRAALDDYEAARTEYYVSFALPGVLLAATATITLLHLGTTHEEPVSVGVALLPDQGTVVARGRF